MAGNKFAAPKQNPYKKAAEEEPQESGIYRFNMKFKMEYKEYLLEMAWRNRCTVTQYLNDLVKADMEAHPEWKDTIDILNK